MACTLTILRHDYLAFKHFFSSKCVSEACHTFPLHLNTIYFSPSFKYYQIFKFRYKREGSLRFPMLYNGRPSYRRMYSECVPSVDGVSDDSMCIQKCQSIDKESHDEATDNDISLYIRRSSHFGFNRSDIFIIFQSNKSFDENEKVGYASIYTYFIINVPRSWVVMGCRKGAGD